MLFKIILIAAGAYLAYTFLTRPRQITSSDQLEVEEDIYVDYEEVNDD